MISQALHSGSAVNSAGAVINGDVQHSSAAMQASVLALNRNFSAVHVLSVRRAFCLIFKELAEVIHVEDGRFVGYDFDAWREVSELRASLDERADHDDFIRAVNFEIQVPRIIRLLKYDRLPRNAVKFNRRNIFLRDEHRCQYCGRHYTSTRLSLDHIMPRSRGGPDTWENVVCACLNCNVRKGGRTPTEAGMKLIKPPVKPPRSPLICRHLAQRKYAAWHTFIGAAASITVE
ncbi:MAG: HNH endonuclease [Planctomycetaceae bacterium]|nr:HNH endonuclease [Planctomycetaceae bacterium]